MNQAATRYRQAVVERALRGPGIASTSARLSAFENQGVDPRAAGLVQKVALRAWMVTDADVNATRTAGVSEDEIFELAVCAALGHATRQLEAALEALDVALPPDVAPAGTLTRDIDGGCS